MLGATVLTGGELATGRGLFAGLADGGVGVGGRHDDAHGHAFIGLRGRVA